MECGEGGYLRGVLGWNEKKVVCEGTEYLIPLRMLLRNAVS